MMKVTLDTNVLISGTFWSGASHKIIDLIDRKKLNLVLSREIIEEYRDVLNYKEIQEKIKNKNLEMKCSLEKIASLSTIVVPTREITAVDADPDDNKILECACAGGVDYIVTQDHHLLNIKEFEGVVILTPEEFLKKISKKKK